MADIRHSYRLVYYSLVIYMVPILPKVTSQKEPCNWHSPSGIETHGRCSHHAWRVNDFDSSRPFSGRPLPRLSLTCLALSHGRNPVQGRMAHMAVHRGGAGTDHLPALYGLKG